ncbi:hypothetical protein HNP84_000220 [Thermocatellispora tengchongensis]|uniref:Uncharacterized protein n=1 Tax=Thermocatellispora tengchongensis TaxID=1073253 RepID=A0A840NTF2_9ACTN|nr:hypothetical protein [Thermocatellispora tengchongensis]MBB5130532.1 hypothetical protein [Thermocatellispora tengchongensis]
MSSGETVWLGDLSGYEVITDDAGAMWLTHRCGATWPTGRLGRPAFLGNLIDDHVRPHMDEGCQQGATP